MPALCLCDWRRRRDVQASSLLGLTFFYDLVAGTKATEHSTRGTYWPRGVGVGRHTRCSSVTSRRRYRRRRVSRNVPPSRGESPPDVLSRVGTMFLGTFGDLGESLRVPSLLQYRPLLRMVEGPSSSRCCLFYHTGPPNTPTTTDRRAPPRERLRPQCTAQGQRRLREPPPGDCARRARVVAEH